MLNFRLFTIKFHVDKALKTEYTIMYFYTRIVVCWPVVTTFVIVGKNTNKRPNERNNQRPQTEGYARIRYKTINCAKWRYKWIYEKVNTLQTALPLKVTITCSWKVVDLYALYVFVKINSGLHIIILEKHTIFHMNATKCKNYVIIINRQVWQVLHI